MLLFTWIKLMSASKAAVGYTCVIYKLIFKDAMPVSFRSDLLDCVHRRNPYIRLELGFQNGRFS